MIKKILVPTDFSDQAQHALKAAAELAQRHHAEIYLLHLLELPEVLIDGPETQQQSELPEALFFMRLAHKKFEELMARPFLKNVNVYETAEFDGAFEGIMEYVKKYQIDLIIMGSHGASGLQEIFIGSNTEKVVRHSEVPVLVIKQEREHLKIKEFAFATDLQEDNLTPVHEAIKLADAEGSALHLVYINTPNNFKTTQEITDLHMAFIEKLGTSKKLEIYNDTSVERGILNYAQFIQADLIGLGTHGRKGLAHFFNGSLSEDLVNHAKRPVITYKI